MPCKRADQTAQDVFVFADGEPLDLAEGWVLQLLSQLLCEVNPPRLVVGKRHSQTFDRL